MKTITCPSARMTPQLAALCADVATWPDPYTDGPVVKRGAVEPTLCIEWHLIEAGPVSRVPRTVKSERHRSVDDVRAEECADYHIATVERFLGTMVCA